jgi:hypothetical protein
MYKVFFDNFLPCVIKKLVFDCQVSVATNDRTLCLISNEAFALLFLENSFDCWQDIYQLQKGEVTPKPGQQRWDFESDVPTKYTKGGIVYDETVKNNDPRGWSAEGIKRYNKLYATVKMDCKANITFTINLLEKKKANLLDAVQTQKRKRPQQQAQIELLDSEDDNSGNKTASADINGANRSDNESSDNENDQMQRRDNH